MSISKSVSQSTGVSVGFWVLNSLHLDAVVQIATIQMNGYLDGTSFTNGNDPVTTTTISVQFVPTSTLPTGVTVLAALYTKIMLDPFFSGATYTNDGV